MLLAHVASFVCRQPEFCDWAFNLPRGDKCLEKWKAIPTDTDILITHGPPIGHGDLCMTRERAGCVDLLHEIQTRIKPKYHVFGHIHEGEPTVSLGYNGAQFDVQTHLWT